MTYAPDDLKIVQRRCREWTGQPWEALGIIHSTPQGGGYHEGEDLLIAAGRAPGPQYPDSDYSYTDDPRDLIQSGPLKGRLAGGDAASAFDLGGGFPRFLEFNRWMRDRLLAGDPRTRDIREMIYTLDGSAVLRLDRAQRKRPNSGDPSHRTHTHFSFFRDSLGRRANPDSFLGLLVEFFEGRPEVLEEVVPKSSDRAAGVVLSDLWNQEMNGGSGYDGQPSKRQRMLAAAASDAAATRSLAEAIRATVNAIAARPATVTLSEADRAAIVAELAKLIPTPEQLAKAVADEQHRRMET